MGRVSQIAYVGDRVLNHRRNDKDTTSRGDGGEEILRLLMHRYHFSTFHDGPTLIGWRWMNKLRYASKLLVSLLLTHWDICPDYNLLERYVVLARLARQRDRRSGVPQIR